MQLPDDFYKHDFKQLAQVEKHPRPRIRITGLSHIQNGKSYEQVAQYLLQSSNGFDIIKMKVSMA